MQSLRILVADRNESFRTALTEFLGLLKGVEVVDQAKSGREAILLTYSVHPHVLLLDHSITEGSKLDIVREIRIISPETKIVVLTFHDAETCRALEEALEVDGCVSKDNVKHDLLLVLAEMRSRSLNNSDNSRRMP